MAGYTRFDVTNQIADTNVINAAPLNGEFDAVEAAFNAVSGHRHDGTSAEGAPITVVGPAQDIVVTATVLRPKTDNAVDLGTSSLEFKDLWIDGTANIDSLVVDTADINGGTIDATVIGGTTPAAATITSLTATSGTVGGSAITTAANTQTLTNKTLTSPIITGGTIDNTVIGATTPAAATVSTLTATSGTVGGSAITTAANTQTLTNKTLTSPTITGGVITGITDLAIADGGTGASSVSATLTNFGVFATRAAFVSAGALGLMDGQIVTAGGLEYRRVAASTAISDLAGYVPNGLPTPAHFGAVVGSDCSAAVSAWLDYAVALGGSDLYVPAGDWTLTSRVVKAVSNCQLRIIGAGRGVSRFLVDNADGGIAINASDRLSQITVTDLSFIAMRPSAGTGFESTMVPGGARDNRSANIERCEFVGDDVTQDCFTIGCDLTGSWRPLVRDVQISGPFGPGITSDLSDTSPMFTGDVCLNLDDCYDPTVDSCHLWSAKICLQATGTDQEAFRLINTVLNGCKRAFVYERTTREPIIMVDNCHWNYRDVGLDINGARLIQIRGSHPYQTDTAAVGPGTPADIRLRNCERVIIADNVFHFDGNPARVNINVESAVFASQVLIANNIFNSLAAIAINIGTATTGAVISGNLFPGTITTKVADNSNSAIILGPGTANEFQIESQADNAAGAPTLSMFRDSASPDVNDAIGIVRYQGRNSAAEEYTYVTMRGVITDPTDGSEDASVQVFSSIAGAASRQLTVGPGVEVGAPTGGGKGAGTLNVEVAIYINNQQVTFGANDSAGAGFKVLRVPN